MQGASVKEILVEACRRNNTELLTEALAGRSEDDISTLLNTTTTVMGNHLYHEAASHGNCPFLRCPPPPSCRNPRPLIMQT